METLFRKTTEHRKAVIVIFILLFVVCGVCKPFVSVNYDMSDYLPEGTPSTEAIEVMKQEYGGGIPNARAMVKNVSIPEALACKERIAAVEGVTAVTWLDDTQDISMPLESMDADAVDSYYRDGCAIFTITIKNDYRLSAVSEIRDIVGVSNCMSGSAVTTAVATESTVSEIAKIAAISVLFALFVLFITTSSWLEPLLIMGGLGVAILINAGSNIIFGEISFVTNAAGSILQLAVSLDYSVFLLHRFNEFRQKIPEPQEAMIQALRGSLSSVLSSGVTTVIGFLALCFMAFRIGPDLGIALAKGVAISLVTVFIFFPALVLSCYRLTERLRHRSFIPSLEGFGRLICKVMIPLALAFVIAIVPAFLASGSNSFLFGASHIFGTDTKAGSDVAEIGEVFGNRDTYVALVPSGNSAREKALSDRLHSLEPVKEISSYTDTVGSEIPQDYLDEDTLALLDSGSYTRLVLTVEALYEGDETFSLVEEVRAALQDFYPDEWYLAGEGVSTYDLMSTVTSDMLMVNLIAIGAVFLVLLLTMRSISLPVILVLAIETAIWINLSISYFTDTSVFYIAYLIISSVQLGATVDYAILFTDRYMEFRETLDRRGAIRRTVSAVTVSVMTSASAMTVIGFLMGAISTHRLLAQFGFFLGRGTLCSLIIVLFVLPGLLYLFDGIIRRTSRRPVTGSASE